ncbi:MAG: hypothetical protein G8237_07310 [Magnetococcales bacterium]|nr:hypothetical protein [Magnetococcales bacterium]
MNIPLITALGSVLTILITSVGYYDYRYSQRLAQTQKLEEQRNEAREGLLELAKRQEIHFSTHNTYTTDLSALGYTDIEDLSVLTPHGWYRLIIPSADNTRFILAAEPQGEQTGDAKCGALTFSKEGQAKGARGSDGTACWSSTPD